MGTNQERIDALAYADRDECHLHIARYFFAADQIGRYATTLEIRTILDAACGMGYGTEILKRNHPSFEVKGLDIDEGTVAYCRTLHSCLDIGYIQADIIKAPAAHAIVSMETIEHVKNWQEVFLHLQTNTRLLLFSVPWKQLLTRASKQFHRVFGLYDESFADLILDGYVAEWYAQRREDYAILPLKDVLEDQRDFLIGIIRREKETKDVRG